jgi:hypothetical protein
LEIESLTLKQIREIQSIFRASDIAENFIGKNVIIRTNSAGVWYGELSKKSCSEVILVNARRMWLWKAYRGISLSAVAVHGIDQSKSKISDTVESVWLEAIEILSCSDFAKKSLEGAKNAEAN